MNSFATAADIICWARLCEAEAAATKDPDLRDRLLTMHGALLLLAESSKLEETFRTRADLLELAQHWPPKPRRP